jgi:Zinc finger, C3HC4 type (RING finger)
VLHTRRPDARFLSATFIEYYTTTRVYASAKPAFHLPSGIGSWKGRGTLLQGQEFFEGEMADLPPMPAPSGAVASLNSAIGLLEQAEQEFNCPICLGTATDPVCISHCGHLGCAECLKQAMDRSPLCPLCKQRINTSHPFLKVHALDNLLSQITVSKEKVEAAKLDVMLRGSSTDGAEPATIERVFKDSVREAINLASGFVTELQAERDKAISEANKSHDAVVAALNASAAAGAGAAGTSAAAIADKIAAAGAKRDDAIKKAKEEYDRAYAALVADSKAYLETVAVPITLMPATVSVSIPSLSLRFDLRIRPTDTISSAIMPAVLKAATEATREVKVDAIEYGADSAWKLVTATTEPGSDAGLPSLDVSKPLFSQCEGGRPRAGIEIRCIGEVKAVSLRATRCLASSWTPGEKQDFSWCRTCGIKWICQACSEACHRSQGHDIIPFLQGHVPTFAVCYCHSKKKEGCKM